MLLTYVAGPVRDKRGPYYVEQNIRHAETVAVMLWRMGFSVVCPHTNTRHMDGAILCDGFADSDVFIKGDLEIVRRCDLVVLLDGYHRSLGTLEEMKCARANAIPLYYYKHTNKLKEALRTLKPRC